MSVQAADIVIREMDVADAEAVSALVTQLGYERPAAETRSWIEDLRRSSREQAAFVAVLDGEVAGWVEVSVKHSLQSPPFALIGGLVVKDGLRGCGIGRRLCARAEEWGWECGVEKVRVTSRSTRTGAHRFYLRDGYQETKTSLVFEKSRAR
jgi:GNAT superfamily N-acetyltransferase